MIFFKGGKSPSCGVGMMAIPGLLIFFIMFVMLYNTMNASRMAMEVSIHKDKPSSFPDSENIVYHLQTSRFVNDLADCILDVMDTQSPKTCKILYQHIPKTGGTYIEHLFGRLIQPDHHRVARWDVALKNTSHYCSKAFQSFEIVKRFDDIVLQCHEEFYRHEPNQRLIILTSMRDPMERELSFIHHRCRGSQEKWTSERLAYCSACRFESHADVWMNFIQQAKNDMLYIQNQTQTLKNFSHYWVDMEDISPMIEKLSQRLSPVDPHYAEAFDFYASRRINRETIGNCSFGFRTEQVKGLKPAKLFYKSFLAGTFK